MWSGQNSVHDTLSESETFSNPSSSERKMHDMLKVNIRKANKFVQPLSSYSKVTPNKNFSRNKSCDVNNILQTLKKFGEKYSLKNVTKPKTVANKKNEDAISDDESVLEIKNKSTYLQSLSDLEISSSVDLKNAGKYSHVHNTVDKLTDIENDIDSSIKTNFKFKLEQPCHTEIPINKLQQEINVNNQNSNKIKKSSHSVLSTKQKIDPKNEVYEDKPSISSNDSIPEEFSISYEDADNSDFKNLAEVYSLNPEVNSYSEEHSLSRRHNFVTYQSKNELETKKSIGDICDVDKPPVNVQHNSRGIGSKNADEFVESPHQFEENNSAPHSVEKSVDVHDLYKIYTIEDLFDKDEEENFKEQTNFHNKTDDNVVTNKLFKKNKIVNEHSADEILDEDNRLKTEEEIAEELDEVSESEIENNVLENSGDSVLLDSSVKTNSSYDEIMNVATFKEDSVVSKRNCVGENMPNKTEQSSGIVNDVDGNTVSTIKDEIIAHHSLQSSSEEHSTKETLLNIRLPSSFRSKHKIIITKSESDYSCSVSAGLMSESGNRKKLGAVENNVKMQVNDSDEQESRSDETLVQSNELAENEADDKQGNMLDLEANKCCSVGVQTENINSMLRSSTLFLNASNTSRQRDVEGSNSLFENPSYIDRYVRQSTEYQEMSTSDDIVFIGMLKHQIDLVKHCMNSQEKMYNAYCDSVKNITRGYIPVTLEDTRQYIRSHRRSSGYVWSD